MDEFLLRPGSEMLEREPVSIESMGVIDEATYMLVLNYTVLEDSVDQLMLSLQVGSGAQKRLR
jgi:hypothetical protein